MRLWHYELISVLPTKMLVSQWRECIAIKRQWEKGTLKHRLVSYVMNYKKDYFNHYVTQLILEMQSRKIKYQEKYYEEINKFCDNKAILKSYPEHNNRYLIQCYFNLQEKYDRKIISEEEWQKISDKINIDYLTMCK